MTRAGTLQGMGANGGREAEGSTSRCPLVLDRVERLVVLQRRSGRTWRALAKEIGYSGSAVSESLSANWHAARLKAETREKILTALEALLEEEER